jgi:predicted small lipoprotein YifL
MSQYAAPFIALAALTLAGCGQKGPLYLPDKGGTVVSSPATTAPATPAPDSAPQAAPAQAAPPKKDNPDEDSQPPQ